MLQDLKLSDLNNLAYMLACVCTIIGIKMLSKPTTARNGMLISAAGTLVAVIAVFFDGQVVDSWDVTNVLRNGYFWCFIAILIGSIIGVIWAKKVQMTGMPELVALFNGFGGLASALVAFSSFYALYKVDGGYVYDAVNDISTSLAIFVGLVTFSV